MLTLVHEDSPALYQINRYTPGCVTVNNQDYTTPMIIMPDFLAELNQENFIYAYSKQPDVVLCSNNVGLLLPAELLTQIRNLEYMSSQALCRTYTVLAAEYRVVMAVLVP